MHSFNNDPQELINVLHTCQEHFGYLPAEVQEVVSEGLNMPVAKIYGVVTFYSFFTMTPKGKTSDQHMPGNSMLCKRC